MRNSAEFVNFAMSDADKRQSATERLRAAGFRTHQSPRPGARFPLSARAHSDEEAAEVIRLVSEADPGAPELPRSVPVR